jgi:Na+-translocating ferredoxin:NAD+ oxidoreductase RnfC subunit
MEKKLRKTPEQVVGGLVVLMKLLDVKQATIAVEANKEDVVRLLSRSLKWITVALPAGRGSIRPTFVDSTFSMGN